MKKFFRDTSLIVEHLTQEIFQIIYEENGNDEDECVFDDAFYNAIDCVVSDYMKDNSIDYLMTIFDLMSLCKAYQETTDPLATEASLDRLFKLPEPIIYKRLITHVLGEYIAWQKNKYELYLQYLKKMSEEEDEKKCDVMHGDCVDDYVSNEYGDDADWIFKTSLKDHTDATIIDELPDFVVIDDNGIKKKGIIIIRVGEEDEEEDEKKQ